MAKTYNTFTNVSTGDVYTAASHNAILQNLAGYRVPPAVMVYRTSDLSYTNNTDITWNAELFDTDDMWTSGATLSVSTAGIYHVHFWTYFTATATVTQLEPMIVQNGTTVRSGQVWLQSSTTGIVERTAILQMTAGQTISARVNFTGGSAYVIKGNATEQTHLTSRLSAVWLGQVS